MPISAVILTAVLLAQADDFVSFKRCYLDTSVSPAQFRPYSVRRQTGIGEDKAFKVRPSAVLYISHPEGGIAGIACTRIATASGRAFVQGSMEEVWRKLQR